MTYLDPRFSQSVNSDRPHKLLTPDTKKSGFLVYLYTDTNEEVLVPNAWYNQPYWCEFGRYEWWIMLCDEHIANAQKVRKNPKATEQEIRESEWLERDQIELRDRLSTKLTVMKATQFNPDYPTRWS